MGLFSKTVSYVVQAGLELAVEPRLHFFLLGVSACTACPLCYKTLDALVEGENQLLHIYFGLCTCSVTCGETNTQRNKEMQFKNISLDPPTIWLNSVICYCFCAGTLKQLL